MTKMQPQFKPDAYRFNYENCCKLLLAGGYAIEIVPGTYEEQEFPGKKEMFSAEIKPLSPELKPNIIAGATDDIIAMIFKPYDSTT